MTEFQSRVKEFEVDRRSAESSKYARLIRRAAGGEELADKDLAALVELHATFGDGADLADVAAAVLRHAELADPAADLPAATEVRNDVLRRRQAWQADSEAADRAARPLSAGDAALLRLYGIDTAAAGRMPPVEVRKARLAELEAERAKLSAEKQAANARLAVAESAARERALIEARHWRVFGGPDPADVAAAAEAERQARLRRRHVCHYGPDGHGLAEPPQYNVLFIELLMRDPSVYGTLSDLEFVPMPGQSADEMAALVALAHRIAAAGRPCRYLRRFNERLPVDAYVEVDVVRIVEDMRAAAGVVGGSVMPDCEWLVGPGQTAAGLAERLAEATTKLTTAEAKALVPGRAVLAPTPYAA